MQPLLGLLFLALGIVSARRSKLVREIRLNELIKESGDWMPYTHAVEDLAFSHNEEWIAVGVGPHGKEAQFSPRHQRNILGRDAVEKIAEFSGFKGGVPAAVASHASRIVISHILFFRGLTEEYDGEWFLGRFVCGFSQQ